MNYQLSEKEFLSVYNMYKPDWFTKFMYKYFSANFKNIGTKILVSYVIIMNVICIFIDNFNNRSLILLPLLLITNIPFFIWGILGVIAFTLNRRRHLKIMNKLHIKTIDQYNDYVKLYVKKEFD